MSQMINSRVKNHYNGILPIQQFLQDWPFILILLFSHVCLSAYTTLMPIPDTSIYCLIILCIFLIGRLAKPGSLFHSTTNYAWLMFSIGGLGMFLGHSLDQLALNSFYTNINQMHGHQHSVMHTSLSDLIFSYMTLLMLLFCIPTCAVVYQCNSKLQAWLFHSLTCLFMLTGMYLSVLIVPNYLQQMNNQQFIQQQWMLIGMTISGAAGFYLCSRMMNRK